MNRVKFNFDRIPDAGIATGGHSFSDDIAFACPQHVAAIKFTLEVDDEEFTCWLTRDEASELANAVVETLCDS